MAGRTNSKSAATTFFAAPTDKAKGRNGRKADAIVVGMLNDALAQGLESFSVPVASVEKVGTVTEYRTDYNGQTATITYNKVKGWAQNNGRKLVASKGFYLSPDGQRLTIATVKA